MFSEKFAMKKHLLILLLLPLLFGCDSGNFNNKNPYIPNYSFSVAINMSLPQYSNLQFPSNAVFVSAQGINIIVFNTGSGFNAYDATCPNQSITSCSTMVISGINARCNCDSALYSLFTGQSPGKEYPMKPYRVEVNGSVLRVYN